MVGLGRLELPTSRLSGVRSNRTELQARTRDQIPEATKRRRLLTDSQKEEIRRGRHFRVSKVGTTSEMGAEPLYYPALCKVNQKTNIGYEILYSFFEILRKEVIQPQVPLRLPCYDFTPVADLTVVGCFLAVSAPASGKTNSHGVTGGVYKARERIHRGMLIRDY